MDAYLDDVCSHNDLKQFEKKYNEEVARGVVDTNTQFEYASFLVRSRYPADIKKGVCLLEDLYKRKDVVGKRDYIFYLGVGNARLKEYKIALNYLQGLLKVEPGNRQVQDLETAIKKRMEHDALIGAAVVGGLAIFGGVALGLGLYAKHKYQRK